MFRILSLDPANSCQPGPLRCLIAGCPESGQAAVDYRRQHGLPDAPHNQVSLTLDLTSESIVRQFPEWQDAQADVRLFTGGGYGDIEYDAKYYHHLRWSTAHALPPALLASLLKEPRSDTAVLSLLQQLRADQAAQQAAAAAQAAVQAQAAAQAQAQLRQEAAAWFATVDPGSLIDWRHSLEHEPRFTYFNGEPAAERLFKALTAEEKQALRAKVAAQIQADRAALWAALLPHLTAEEQAMHQRGLLCPQCVQKRLDGAARQEAAAKLFAKPSPFHLLRREKHQAKPCASVEEFRQLRDAEERLGLTGTVDVGDDHHRYGLAFTLTTADGRPCTVVAYPTDSKIEPEQDADEDDE